MNWIIVLIIFIIIIVLIIYEFYGDRREYQYLKADGSVYIITYEDGSMVILRTSDISIHPKVLERKIEKDIKSISPTDGIVFCNNHIKPKKSVLHGAILYGEENLNWLHDSLESLEHDISSIGLLLAGTVIRTNWVLIRTMFSYADDRRNTIAHILKPENLKTKSMAEKIKIIDYVKRIKIINDKQGRVEKKKQ
jgi:hypothetical protein